MVYYFEELAMARTKRELTEFGKEFYKQCIDADISLREVAEKLNVSETILYDAVRGKRAITPELISKLAHVFGNGSYVRNKFVRTAVISEAPLGNLTISLVGATPDKLRLALELYEKFDNLSDVDIKMIGNALGVRD